MVESALVPIGQPSIRRTTGCIQRATLRGILEMLLFAFAHENKQIIGNFSDFRSRQASHRIFTQTVYKRTYCSASSNHFVLMFAQEPP